jgi:hypothetical protein
MVSAVSCTATISTSTMMQLIQALSWPVVSALAYPQPAFSANSGKKFHARVYVPIYPPKKENRYEFPARVHPAHQILVDATPERHAEVADVLEPWR